MRVAILSLFLLCFAAVPAFAESADGGASTSISERLTLAQKMHDIRPVRVQVGAAVDQVIKTIPVNEQEQFKTEIMASFDFDALGESSVNAMAELFSVAELTRMTEYFGSEEAVSISQKMPVYEEMLRPEIMAMLNKALMKMRTGDIAEE